MSKAWRFGRGVLLALWPAAGEAAAIRVISTNGSGQGSLRRTLLNAHADSGSDTIAFAISEAPGWRSSSSRSRFHKRIDSLLQKGDLT